MTRETAAHVAELAALLATRLVKCDVPDGDSPYLTRAARPNECARAALALCREASKLHRIAERECNEDTTCRECDGAGQVAVVTADPGTYAERATVTTTSATCRKCLGTGSTQGRRRLFAERRVRDALAPFGLFAAFQTDPRGWPVALFASQADAESWSRDGSPRELLRVTPHA